ncbi:MAG TPA: hypothetical protein VNI78_12025 [Vicinamibacterales bacterium]|nr:hypothetical protein [Vicinamibacterales bacterium]
MADADAMTRLTVDRQLEMLGWDPLTVNTGAEAIRVVQLGLPVSILLTELDLPDLDGRSVAWTVTQLQPDVRVAFMCARVPGVPLEPRDAPLLVKPFSTSALDAALQAAIHYPRQSGRR